ncbi:TetR/AcrR family transcriptional regulator [Nocardia carnea]|uniref:TetR/AcrR family transcriptional regulator n=1 Tax=Nocardia carnea TaxID=37328 RepID=A0ABW7TM90_9NOCA|nr:TetR/AcrR family transcriptional regulator [Nocardia carnea]
MVRQGDAVDEKIMDAALVRLLQVGIRRASLDDIARRSGLNRVTIYRRFAGKDNLIEAVIMREIERMLAEVGRISAEGTDVDDQIARTALFVLRQARTHPLLTQLIEVSPEEAIEFYTVRGEEMVSSAIGYIVTMLEHGQAAGTIDDYDPRPVAELLARLAHSLLLTPLGGVDFRDEEQAAAFVRMAVVPLVRHGATVGAGVARESPAADRSRTR